MAILSWCWAGMGARAILANRSLNFWRLPLSILKRIEFRRLCLEKILSFEKKVR
jgi:hypothetical protein